MINPDPLSLSLSLLLHRVPSRYDPPYSVCVCYRAPFARVQVTACKSNRPWGLRRAAVSRLHNDTGWASGTCLTRSSLPPASLSASPPPSSFSLLSSPACKTRGFVLPCQFSEAKRVTKRFRDWIGRSHPLLRSAIKWDISIAARLKKMHERWMLYFLREKKKKKNREWDFTRIQRDLRRTH